MEEKTINASSEDKLEEHCMGELMDAAMDKDVGKFRAALEALILNLFEEMEKDDARSA